MTVADNPEVTKLRNYYGYRDRFDIVLACAFEECEQGAKNFGFYDKIGDIAKGYGRRIFLPHKNINPEWDASKTYEVVNRIVVPESDLMIAYLGVQSTAAGIMMMSAKAESVPIIGVCESESMENLFEMRRKYIEFWKIVSFEDEKRGLASLGKAIGSFYAGSRWADKI